MATIKYLYDPEDSVMAIVVQGELDPTPKDRLSAQNQLKTAVQRGSVRLLVALCKVDSIHMGGVQWIEGLVKQWESSGGLAVCCGPSDEMYKPQMVQALNALNRVFHGHLYPDCDKCILPLQVLLDYH